MKKMVGYHSPKEYKERPVIQEQSEQHDCICGCSFCRPGGSDESCIHWADYEPKKKLRKSKYCKLLKGPHQYGEWQQEMSSFYPQKPLTGFFIRHCIKCNRKDTWLAPTLPGNYWRLDPNARPPLDK